MKLSAIFHPWLHRHGRCRGVVLWRWGTRQVELWLVPAGEYVPRHTHPNVESTLRIWSVEAEIGVLRPGRKEQREKPSMFCGRAFDIGPLDVHWLMAWTPTFLLNVQRWVGRPPSSAAVDWVDA